MPQLPSGRHVAIQANALTDLLGHANEPQNVHKIMAIDSIEKVLGYFEILYLVPSDDAKASGAGIALRKGSDRPPDGLAVMAPGLRLSEYESEKAGWSAEDRAAFREFLVTRANTFIQDAWARVEAAKHWLLTDAPMAARILALWYQAGCHPAQEEGWNESDVGGPEWDDCDVIAALGQVKKMLSEQPEFQSLWETQARIDGLWPVLTRALEMPEDWPDPAHPVRECAAQLRQSGILNRLSEERRQWIHQQGIVEAVELWNVLGERFRTTMPQPYGVVELVVCSREADQFFQR